MHLSSLIHLPDLLNVFNNVQSNGSWKIHVQIRYALMVPVQLTGKLGSGLVHAYSNKNTLKATVTATARLNKAESQKRDDLIFPVYLLWSTLLVEPLP